MALRLALVSLDSTVLIFIFAGFNLLLFFCCILCSFCCYLVCPSEMSLHLKIIFTGRYALPKFRWIQLSRFMNQVFPVAKSDLWVLKRLGLDKKRVDIIGKVVAKKEQELPNHLKCDLYIKDESDKELKVQLWGETMVQKARTIPLGEVVQVDNAILQRQVETGTIAATAEAGKDSKRGFCAWLHISPPGSRTEALQALTLERVEAISSAWAGSLSGGSSLRPTTGKSKAIVTCCSTAAACSIVAGESSDVVEIQLHGVWLAGVRGADVAYWACKKCKTKVDQETGSCKKHSTHGCATEQEDNRTILATVHLADWTGQLDNLLVNEAALCELTGFKTAELLLQEVDRHGTVPLCFRHRCDVRVATSPKHKQWSQLSLSASQASPAEVRTSQQECQFEVVHAKPALIADFDESRRPCVPKILRLEAWFKMLFTFYMFRILEFLGLGDACCSFCHLLTGPPHRRQHRAGVGLGRGLGIHGAWSGFHKSRRDVRVRDHPCQDHGGGRSEKFADSWCSMDEVRTGYTYFWFPKTFCCGRGHPNSKGFAI